MLDWDGENPKVGMPVDAPKLIFALTADFNFGAKISEAAKALGARSTAVRSLEDLPARLGVATPDLVVVDLQLDRLDPAFVVQQVQGGAGGAPVIAFGRHTEPGPLRAARQAGCAEVLVRSDFFPRLAEVLGKHLGAGG